MEKNILKNAFFGYSKNSVCEYIAKVNGEFSERLTAAAEDAKKEREALNAKISELEKELDSYRKLHGDISAALLEAQKHAAELKEESEAENKKLREQNAEKREAENKRIECYKAQIDEIRRGLSLLAADTDSKLSEYLKKMNGIEREYGGKDGTDL